MPSSGHSDLRRAGMKTGFHAETSALGTGFHAGIVKNMFKNSPQAGQAVSLLAEGLFKLLAHCCQLLRPGLEEESSIFTPELGTLGIFEFFQHHKNDFLSSLFDWEWPFLNRTTDTIFVLSALMESALL